jgi:uncharacterized protein
MKPLDVTIVPNANLQFIIKTTFDCNMNCKYCYEGCSQKGLKMSFDTVKALTQRVADHARETGVKHSFLWHGGEPLLAGKDFYKYAIGLQHEMGNDFLKYNILQTNGILIDPEYARLLSDLQIGVGVSLDGPPDIHDAQRLTHNQKGTFKQAFRGLQLMHEHGQRAGALSVFTKNTFNNLEKYYNFFSELELDVKMNPLFIAGNAKDLSSAHLQVTPTEYKEALLYLFDRWINDKGKNFSFDPFDSTARTMVSGVPYACNVGGGCVYLLKVFPNGNVHACGHQPYEKHVLGNVHRDDLNKILSSPHRRAYKFARASLAETCGKTCEHFDICAGGCVSNSYSIRGRLTDKSFYCESMKALYDHMKPKVLARKEAVLRNQSIIQMPACS